MSLSLSVHPLTQRKQSHFGSVLSHFKPQRSCTYRGMLSRKQNQNSTTSTTVHLQGKKKLLLCAFNNYPKTIVIRWHELQKHFFCTFQRLCNATNIPLSSLAGTPLLQKVLGQWYGASKAKDNMVCCTLLLDNAAYVLHISSGQELL